MENEQLLQQFVAHIDEFDRFHGYVEKARAQSDAYREAVIEVVVADYEERKLETVGALMLVQADVEGAVESLRARRATTEEGANAAQLTLEEQDLRLAIGELDDDGYQAATAELGTQLDAAKAALSALDTELEALTGALERWEESGSRGGALQAA